MKAIRIDERRVDEKTGGVYFRIATGEHDRLPQRAKIEICFQSQETLDAAIAEEPDENEMLRWALREHKGNTAAAVGLIIKSDGSKVRG